MEKIGLSMTLTIFRKKKFCGNGPQNPSRVDPLPIATAWPAEDSNGRDSQLGING